jgi:RNase H-fold protein (predicted Holliday junction resolvase)
VILLLAYTEAGKAIGFALEQPLHVVALPCSALRISKRLQHTNMPTKILNKSACCVQTIKLNLMVEVNRWFFSVEFNM